MKNKKQQKPELASDVLQTLLQNGKSPLAEQFIRWKVWNSWGEIVGEQIAKHTLPVSYLKGELYVWVDHPARMQELTFCISELGFKINQFCRKKWVRRIRFTLDRKSVPKPEETAEGLRDFLSTKAPNAGGRPPRGR